MTELDEMLTRMGSVPLPPQLAMMDEAVFFGLAEYQKRSASASLRSLGVAAVAALSIGIVSTSLPGSPAAAAAPVTPFGAPPALAPSSLLLASQ